MKVIVDTFFKSHKPLSLRETVRAFVVNEKKQIALINVVVNDKFGNRNHLETPGGGIDNDEREVALRREIEEELGYKIKNIREVGKIGIEYRVIDRMDYGYFYVCETSEFVGCHLEEYEKEVFKNILWVDIDKVIDFYDDFKVEGIQNNIHERDLTMFKLARERGML